MRALVNNDRDMQIFIIIHLRVIWEMTLLKLRTYQVKCDTHASFYHNTSQILSLFCKQKRWQNKTSTVMKPHENIMKCFFSLLIRLMEIRYKLYQIKKDGQARERKSSSLWKQCIHIWSLFVVKNHKKNYPNTY